MAVRLANLVLDLALHVVLLVRNPVFSLGAVEVALSLLQLLTALGGVDGSRSNSLLFLDIADLLLEALAMLLVGLDELDVLGVGLGRMVLQVDLLLLLLLSKAMRVRRRQRLRHVVRGVGRRGGRVRVQLEVVLQLNGCRVLG